jgi:hypothetical protein
MSPEEVREAYQRGVRDGAIDELDKGMSRAHDRLDKHDVRMTALEKVMYAGMGAVVLLEVLPQISLWVAK